MIVKLLTEHHLEFLSLTGGCGGSTKSTLVKISNCWKSHAAAHFSTFDCSYGFAVQIYPQYTGVPVRVHRKQVSMHYMRKSCVGVRVVGL